jgi:SOS-response transcriptional repressor LexA
MKNISSRIECFEPLPISERVKALRKARGWNQVQLAELTGVSQGQVSLWEKGINRPSPAVLALLARHADDADRAMWVAEAGMSQFIEADDESEMRHVPVLKDAAAAGTPRAVDPANIELQLTLPRRWLPRSGKLFALHVKGDSMAPVVNDGYLVLVNVSERRPSELVGRMVAARDSDGGVTIKWLRKDDDMFFLVPQNTSERHPIRMLRDEGDWSIVGEVVKIIGDPPAPRKTRGG